MKHRAEVHDRYLAVIRENFDPVDAVPKRNLPRSTGGAVESNFSKSKLLEEGAERIEKYGWIQEQYGDEKIGFCLLGSIKCNQTLSVFMLSDLLEPVWGNRTRRNRKQPFPVIWNDSPGRTKEEVLELLMEAAKYWRDKGE